MGAPLAQWLAAALGGTVWLVDVLGVRAQLITPTHTYGHLVLGIPAALFCAAAGRMRRRLDGWGLGTTGVYLFIAGTGLMSLGQLLESMGSPYGGSLIHTAGVVPSAVGLLLLMAATGLLLVAGTRAGRLPLWAGPLAAVAVFLLIRAHGDPNTQYSGVLLFATAAFSLLVTLSGPSRSGRSPAEGRPGWWRTGAWAVLWVGGLVLANALAARAGAGWVPHVVSHISGGGTAALLAAVASRMVKRPALHAWWGGRFGSGALVAGLALVAGAQLSESLSEALAEPHRSMVHQAAGQATAVSFLIAAAGFGLALVGAVKARILPWWTVLPLLAAAALGLTAALGGFAPG